MIGRIIGLIHQKERAEDPVCHMLVDASNPPGGSYPYQDNTYYFCGAGCRVAFSKEPDSYLSGEKRIDMER